VVVEDTMARERPSAANMTIGLNISSLSIDDESSSLAIATTALKTDAFAVRGIGRLLPSLRLNMLKLSKLRRR